MSKQTREETQKMLRAKTKYMNNADKYSTKKQAFKAGWKAGAELARERSIGFADFLVTGYWAWMKYDEKWHNMVDNTLNGMETSQLYDLYLSQLNKQQ
jgi:hypothetical protein